MGFADVTCPITSKAGLLEARSGQVQQELQSILSLLDEEKSALTRYGSVISQAARGLRSQRSDGQGRPHAIAAIGELGHTAREGTKLDARLEGC